MSNQKPIEGKVAAIINERELAINVGSKAGIKEHMHFKVLAATPLEVKDPDTGEVLDQLDQEKVRVQVVEVREKTTVCRTYRTRTIPGGSLSRFINPMGNALAPEITITETLKTAAESKPRPLSEEDSYVKIGDRVVQIIGADDD